MMRKMVPGKTALCENRTSYLNTNKSPQKNLTIESSIVTVLSEFVLW